MYRDRRTVSGFISLSVFILMLILAFGCQMPSRRPVAFLPPQTRPLEPADDPFDDITSPGSRGPLTTAPGCSAPFDEASVGSCPMRRPRNILALSGGGAYGAYSAGYIDGWTRSGTRPEFDVVTGISTGSLIAPFAFLGPEADDRLRQLYTRVQATDIFRIRSWVSIPFRDSVASSAPFKKLIDQEITPDLMNRIAAEHRKGRRLYVGTTNLDTRRLVVWDLGAIAARPCPEGCSLFRDVLLASCSVPAMLPPVRFETIVDGKKITELHADGGIAAQLFVPSHVFAAAARGAMEDAIQPAKTNANDNISTSNGNLYVIVAGKLYPDAGPVRARVLPVLGAATTTLLYAYCRAELANLYGLSRAAGINYHLTALPQGFLTFESSVDFDQVEMAKLFEEGRRQATSIPAWMTGPPTLSPGDGDYIRSGLKLRSVGE